MPSPKKKSLTAAPGAIAQNLETVAQSCDNYAENERVRARRAEMLRRRQVDLDIVMNDHDDLVREAFQLDKFITLLSYDPKVAKQDNSQVFLEYKEARDLLSRTVDSSGPGHNSRKTRRATTELRGSFTSTISASSSNPPSTPATTPSKGKGTLRIISGLDSMSPLGRPTGRTRIQTKDVTPSSAVKGKGKAKELFSTPSSNAEAMLPPPASTRTQSKREQHSRKVKDGLVRPKTDTLEQSSASFVHGSRRLTRKDVSSPSPSMLPPDKVERTRRSSGKLKRDSVVEKIGTSERTMNSISQVPPKQTIKRVRLFQRPRPAVYTHASQLPPRPLHRNSIANFLNSFVCLEDGVDVSHDELERLSFAEAKTRSRIRDLRRQGRLLLDIPDLPDGSIGIPSFAVAHDAETEPMRSEDQYDRLIAAASRRGVSVAAEYAAKRALAKRVAKLIIGWHANKENTVEKQRKAEALRIRALAKFTIKEVEKQWKKAVMAVREHNRAILEAEEVRIGRKHLDAILDQSGAILEAQHTDLSRARSRSSSARDWSGSDESNSEGEHDQDTEEDASVEDPEEDTSDRQEDDADVAYLLGTDVVNSLGSSEPSSDLDDSSTIRENRGSYRKVTPPSRSEGSQDDVYETTDVSLSRTPSEVTAEHPALIRTETYLSSAFSSTIPASEESEISQAVSEAHSDALMDTDPVVNTPVELDSTDLPTELCAHGKGFQNTSSTPPLYHDRATSLVLSPSSPTPSSYATKTHAQESPKPEEPGINGRNVMAVRLSNGVVIYRDVDTTLLPESPSVISPNESNEGDRQLDMSPRNDLGKLMSSAEVTHDHTCEIPLEASGSLSHEAISPANPDPPGLTADNASTGVSVIPSILDDADPQGDLFTAVSPDVTSVEKEVLHVETDDQEMPPSDANGIEDFDADEPQIAPHLLDFAVAPVEWDTTSKVNPPFLLRGILRPYQQSGLEWLASLHTNSLNGILADEMGLGKTIQTISLLAHLACDRGIWGPHLIVVPTSVLLNWEMEFKKFLPGFRILSYHGSTKRRKELRVGWNNKHSFNVCVTSYTLASRDAHIFKRKSWYYMVLDEAHMIKNFKSQRWNILLMFRSFRRLLLTGTPLQNNLTELWALLQFLMSGTNFANLKEFGDWFSNPLEKAIEQGTVLDEETQERVRKLHTVLRPYLLRRLKSDVEKELPSKYEHLVVCRLSKRQRFLYDEFMSRAQTRDALASGVYHKVANILMQLRKVCNHPDLFEVRPIVTSFAMPRSATIDFEIKELLVRRKFMQSQEDFINTDFLGLVFVQYQGRSMMQARATRALDASSCLPLITELPGEPPPVDTRTIEGFKRHMKHQQQLAALRRWTQIAYTNRLRCATSPVYGSETISVIRSLAPSLSPLSEVDFRQRNYLDRSRSLPILVKSYEQREEDMAGIIDRFAFVTPPVVARDMPSIALSGFEVRIRCAHSMAPRIDTILHRTSVKLQVAFPDSSLIQYDCGKLQELSSLLRMRKAGGHRVLIFTQMTKVLDILEIFLNFHGYRYLRLDGATKIEDRQYITERFNTDDRVFAFIASSRSGGVGINLTGADTVVFYDSDFNPQMDRQCEDRAHRIGQIRDVHIYRFISEHTVEESMLRKANQKRSLDNIVIQQGEFDWRSLLIDDEAFGKALGEFEDKEDAHAARVAAREEAAKEVEDRADFAGEGDEAAATETPADVSMEVAPDDEEELEEGGTIADYMLAFVKTDWEFFSALR